MGISVPATLDRIPSLPVVPLSGDELPSWCAPQAALSQRILCVLARRASEHVRRVYAARVVTGMADAHALSDRPVCQFVAHAMGQIQQRLTVLLTRELAIAVRVDIPTPFPATIGLDDVSPEFLDAALLSCTDSGVSANQRAVTRRSDPRRRTMQLFATVRTKFADRSALLSTCWALMRLPVLHLVTPTLRYTRLGCCCA